MNDLIWSQQARLDLHGIADRYHPIDSALADIMLDRIMAAPTPLRDHPFLGAPIGAHDLRKWQVRQTPYLLLYQVRSGVIEIARIRHERQDWQVGL